MNKVILMGRLTRDPEVRYSAGDNSTAVARYTLAVNRRFKRDNEPTADFVPGFEIHGKLTYIILALLMAVFSIEEKKEA